MDDLLCIVQERRENPKSAHPGSRWGNFDMSELPSCDGETYEAKYANHVGIRCH